MEESLVYNKFRLMDAFVKSANIFNVISIQDTKHKIGKTEDGWPKIFVKTKDVTGHIHPHNVNGELLWVEYNNDCCVIDENNLKTDSNFTIITLHSDIESLQKIFIEIFVLSLITIPLEPTENELSLKIEGLLSIFSSLKKKPIHKIQGLWAELLVIEQSKVPGIVAEAWHNSPKSKYDFTNGAEKIEVKSTSSDERIHLFTLDQLNPTTSSQLLICSVIVRESGHGVNGISVSELYNKICMRISDINLRSHMYSVIYNTLGNEYEKADTVYFDYIGAIDSLRYYDYKDVPKIDKAIIPAFVNGVKFNSNLEHIDDIVKKGYKYDKNSLLGSI